MVHEFTDFGSSVSDTLSLVTELNKPVGRGVIMSARLTSRVWDNSKLIPNNKVAVNRTCVVNLLLYDSDTWSFYSRQEILLFDIWDAFSAPVGLTGSPVPSSHPFPFTQLIRSSPAAAQLALTCISYAGWEDFESHSELVTGRRSRGRPHLRTKDVYRRDMRAMDMVIEKWEDDAKNR